MAYWILMFRPDTYELVQRHQTIGVRDMHRRRFAELAKGDKFVVYVSKEQLLDAHGEFTGDPFEDDEPIFGEGQDYPQRCRVKFLETGFRQEAGDNLWYLSPFTEIEMKTTPTNYMRCYGGFMKISAEDYRWLLDVMSGKCTPAKAASR